MAIYHPQATIDPSLPTIFFAHGYTSPIGDPATYGSLLHNLASRGFNVVFSPFEGGLGIDIPKRFDQLTTGFVAAVDAFGLNTDKIGFVGHSYGAGFQPATIQHLMMGVTNQRGTPGHQWGSSAVFAYSMAPGYTYGGLPATQGIVFPSHLSMVVQVFNDDTSLADPSMAIDIFSNTTIPREQKDFLIVYGDDYGNPAQTADHFLPNNGTSSAGLQAWGVFRHIDALAEFSLKGDPDAREIALGNGTPSQEYMGTWTDGMSVVPLQATDDPDPGLYAMNNYVVHWDSPANPRSAFQIVPSADFDNDGDVDGRDFLAWQRNPSIGNLSVWQANYGAGSLAATSNAVPEPGSLTLGAALITLCFAQRRQFC